MSALSRLPLLGPEFASQTPETFLEHVNSLRKAPHRKATKPAKAKRQMLKGRIIKAAGKHASGNYEVEFAGVKSSLIFSPQREIERSIALEVAKELRCDLTTLEKFLSTKRFTLKAGSP